MLHTPLRVPGRIELRRAEGSLDGEGPTGRPGDEPGLEGGRLCIVVRSVTVWRQGLQPVGAPRPLQRFTEVVEGPVSTNTQAGVTPQLDLLPLRHGAAPTLPVSVPGEVRVAEVRRQQVSPTLKTKSYLGKVIRVNFLQ